MDDHYTEYLRMKAEDVPLKMDITLDRFRTTFHDFMALATEAGLPVKESILHYWFEELAGGMAEKIEEAKAVKG